MLFQQPSMTVDNNHVPKMFQMLDSRELLVEPRFPRLLRDWLNSTSITFVSVHVAIIIASI